MAALTTAEIARLCNGELFGDGDRIISGANDLAEAGAGELSFVVGAKYEAAALNSQAGCLLVTPSFTSQTNGSRIQVADPRQAFAAVLQRLYPAPLVQSFRHHTASIDGTASLGLDVFIGPYVTIGPRAVIGDRCRIEEMSSIGPDVVLGEDCSLGPRVTLYERVTIGSRARLHAGCVIGADGFGFAFNPATQSYGKFPQVGTVVIGNDVEVGANSCIDRAALGVTRIGDGCKLDNLVHIGHNCTVGKHVVMAAQCGLSGGVTVGDYALLGGQVGIADKAQIASRATLGAQAGVLPSKRIPAGEPYWGTPARPLKQLLKQLAYLGKAAGKS